MAKNQYPMIEHLTRAEYEALLRRDFATFAARCFHDLNPQAELAMNWHLEVIKNRAPTGSRGEIDTQGGTAHEEDRRCRMRRNRNVSQRLRRKRAAAGCGRSAARSLRRLRGDHR
jgi:hypothetical protein